MKWRGSHSHFGVWFLLSQIVTLALFFNAFWMMCFVFRLEVFKYDIEMKVF
jgi:hypothetical protein